jgi:hypothetical protein
MRVRFDELRAIGICTIMISGDNRLTAAPTYARRSRSPLRMDARSRFALSCGKALKRC